MSIRHLFFPKTSENFQIDFDQTFANYSERVDGYKLLICLANYGQVNLQIEGNSIFIGMGNTKKQSLSGFIKLSNAAFRLEREFLVIDQKYFLEGKH